MDECAYIVLMPPVDGGDGHDEAYERFHDWMHSETSGNAPRRTYILRRDVFERKMAEWQHAVYVDCYDGDIEP